MDTDSTYMALFGPLEKLVKMDKNSAFYKKYEQLFPHPFCTNFSTETSGLKNLLCYHTKARLLHTRFVQNRVCWQWHCITELSNLPLLERVRQRFHIQLHKETKFAQRRKLPKQRVIFYFLSEPLWRK